MHKKDNVVAMTDETLPLLEQQMAARFGRPVEQLYAEAGGQTADPAVQRVLEWHQRLVHTDAWLRRCEDALLAHLTSDQVSLAEREREMAEPAERLAAAVRARAAVATTLLNLFNAPPPTQTTTLAHSRRAAAAARTSPAVAAGRTDSSSRTPGVAQPTPVAGPAAPRRLRP